MAATVIGAAIVKWDALSFSGKPDDLWFDGVPLKTATTVVSLPTVELVHNGTTPDYDFEYNPIETTEMMFVVRGVARETVAAIVSGIRFNGGAVTAGAGFDFGTLTVTGQTLKSMKLERVQEGRDRAVFDAEGKPVHRTELYYKVMTVRTA